MAGLFQLGRQFDDDGCIEQLAALLHERIEHQRSLVRVVPLQQRPGRRAFLRRDPGQVDPA